MKRKTLIPTSVPKSRKSETHRLKGMIAYWNKNLNVIYLCARGQCIQKYKLKKGEKPVFLKTKIKIKKEKKK